MTRHQSPELPDLEMHSPEKPTTKFNPDEFNAPLPVHCICDGPGPDPDCPQHKQRDAEAPPAPPEKSDFEASSWGPRGNEFARFTLSGDCKVTIYHPAPGIKTIAVEVETGCEPFVEGAPDTRRQTVLQLPKARARALASAIMGAAAEL